MTSQENSFRASIVTDVCVIYRALVGDLLYLSQLSTLVAQSLMTQCMFGWKTWILEVLKFASGNSCHLTDNIKTQLWYVKFTIFQFPIMHSACPPSFAWAIVVKYSWESLPRVFYNNSLCKTWGANSVHYGKLENS